MKRPTRVSERVAWFEGSALTRRDLDEAVAYESRMLELHVSGLHRSCGIANGLTVALSDDSREVIVSPGFAYTGRGETLILPALVRTAPRAASTTIVHDLVLAPPAEAELCERPATCTGDTIIRRASLRWEPVGPSSGGTAPLGAGVRPGVDVPLARFICHTNGTLVGPDKSQRRMARALVRPHVAFGTASAGTLHNGTADFYTTIDTTAAGFTVRPFYFARVRESVAIPAGVLGPLVSVQYATSTSFEAHLLFGLQPGAPTRHENLRTLAASLTIAWVGVEPVLGCAPPLRVLQFLALGLSPGELGNWSTALAALTWNGP